MKSRELLQNLQDVFAEQLQLTVLILDMMGRPLTTISHLTPLTKKMLQLETNNFIQSIVENKEVLVKVQRPLVVDACAFLDFSGMKFLLAPIQVDGVNTYFIWAGLFVEQGNRGKMTEKLNDRQLETNKLPEHSAFEIEQKLQTLEKMSALAEEIAGKQFRRQSSDSLLLAISSLLRNKEIAPITPKKIVQTLFASDQKIDFVGYAKCVNDTDYLITHFMNGSSEQPVCLAISIRGTFLYDAIERKQFQAWSHVNNDLRSFFLHPLNIDLKALFCIPIIVNGMPQGVYFGGSINFYNFSTLFCDFGSLFYEVINVLHELVDLEVAADRQLMRISSLMEMRKAMNLVKKKDELLYMLVDVALQLIPGDFCVVSLGDGTKVHKMNCPNLNVEELLERILPTDSLGETKLLETKWGSVLQQPLLYDDERFGMIAIHLVDPTSMNEAEVFLTSLAQMGSFTLKNILKQQVSADDDFSALLTDHSSIINTLTAREIEVLHHLIDGSTNRDIAEKLFISIHTVKNHITNIFQKLGVSDRSHLIAMIYQLNMMKQ